MFHGTKIHIIYETLIKKIQNYIHEIKYESKLLRIR